MTIFQWIGVIVTVCGCIGGLILCKKKTPEIFGGYAIWICLVEAASLIYFLYISPKV